MSEEFSFDLPKHKPEKRPDLKRLQSDPAYFAEALLGIRLHDFQKAVLRDKAATVVHVAGRGAGKTIEAAVLVSWFLYTKRKSMVAYISATDRQGKISRDTILGMLAGTELWDSIIDSSYDRIALSNGSRVYFIPGRSDVGARGLHNQLVREDEHLTEILLCLDESANIPQSTWVASAGILTAAPEGNRKRFIIGSPLGTNSWFYTEYMAGLDPSEKYTSSHTTNAEHVPHVSKHYLDEMKGKLSPIEYNAEIRAEFQESLNSFFAGYIDGAITQHEIPLPATDVRGLEYSLGVDLSSSARLGSDFTVLVVVEKWWGGYLGDKATLTRTFAFVIYAAFNTCRLSD